MLLHVTTVLNAVLCSRGPKSESIAQDLHITPLNSYTLLLHRFFYITILNSHVDQLTSQKTETNDGKFGKAMLTDKVISTV